MKRIVLILASVCLLCFVSLAADSVGLIIAVEGVASATDANGQTRSLALKSPVYMMDRIQTTENAKLQIMFNDDSVVSQGPEGEMVIDQYVYAPEQKDDNAASMNLVKGVFRVVTGKITKLNPDRFNVKTRMATIGIRGCDLGFRVTPQGENVYIIQLHGVENVIITTVETRGEATGLWQGLVEQQWGEEPSLKKLLNVLNSGMIVSITTEGDLEQRSITPDELVALIQEVTPDASEQPPGDETGDSDANQDENAPESNEGEANGTDDESDDPSLVEDPVPEGDPVDDELGGFDDGTDLGDPLVGDEPLLVDDPMVTDGSGSLPPPPLPTEEQVYIPEDNTEDPETPLDAASDEPSDPGPDQPTSGNTAYTQQGTGIDWEWGIWETDGVLSGIEVGSASIISPVNLQSLVDGTIAYSLSGPGSAGAILTAGSYQNLVSGSCSIGVDIPGYGSVPTWNGTFGLSGNGDMLNFSALGTVQAGNNLTGSVEPGYNLLVNGSSYSDTQISAESFGGNLLGTGTGANPITGVMGTFNFDHAGAAQVNGVFGADFGVP
ncbi:MAG: hypothetical protein A2340_14465 [Lentisphaerae bacterium RIFOXYB12_FULL_60_10]|nr:MAG: hypothetical protein A2340_14465 [Lentisphaerae bacterium RIFOXYB12_FULL_60_10]